MNARRSASAACVHDVGTWFFALRNTEYQVFPILCVVFWKAMKFGCERGYAASAANSLAQLAFFNGLAVMTVRINRS